MTAAELELEIEQAIRDGVLIDLRHLLPTTKPWPVRDADDILGFCVHHNGSSNQDPFATARYDCSAENHITPHHPLPGITYTYGVSRLYKAALLLNSPLARTYAQNAPENSHPGDENTHLASCVVFGRYASQWDPGEATPTADQMVMLANLWQWHRRVFKNRRGGLFCHSMLGKASCPGTALENWTRIESSAYLMEPDDWPRLVQFCPPRATESTRAHLVRAQTKLGVRRTGVFDPFTRLRLAARLAA